MDILKTIGSCVVAMVAVAAGLGNASAAPLSFVNVRAPVHCIFNTPCAVVASTDSFATIDVSSLVWSGTAHLQSRTFSVTFASPIGLKNFYEYRVDLTQTITNADAACITDLSIDFGPVIKLQYNGAGPLDDGYVLFQGGVGSIGLSAVDETNGVITFTFSQPICAGTTPGTGQASRLFGLASAFPPRAVVAKVSVPGLDPIDVQARAPEQRKH